MTVGHAYAVLHGFRMGNPQKASEFLSKLDPAALREMSRQESVGSVRGKARKRYKMGQKTRRQLRSRRYGFAKT